MTHSDHNLPVALTVGELRHMFITYSTSILERSLTRRFMDRNMCGFCKAVRNYPVTMTDVDTFNILFRKYGKPRVRKRKT
jgi:hypothetical protein